MNQAFTSAARVFRLLAVATLLALAFTPAALGDELDRAVQNPVDGEPSCVFYDTCTPISSGPDSTGTKYSYCVARASLGQKCQSVVTIYAPPGNLCATGCNMCGSVTQSASCHCDQEKLETTGSCTYW